MREIAEYEQAAAECRRLAAQAKNPQVKNHLEKMAEIWARLASERRQDIVENDLD
jgi:hypothetical protein